MRIEFRRAWTLDAKSLKSTIVSGNRTNVCFVPILRVSFSKLDIRFFHIRTMELFALKFKLTGCTIFVFSRLIGDFFMDHTIQNCNRAHCDYDVWFSFLSVLLQIFTSNLNAVLVSFLIFFIRLSFLFGSITLALALQKRKATFTVFKGIIKSFTYTNKKKLTLTLEMIFTKKIETEKKKLNET